MSAVPPAGRLGAMCGRYNLIPSAHAWADLAQVLGNVVAEALRELPPRYNVAPDQTMPIIVMDKPGQPALLQARWGFIPPWWDQPVPPRNTSNARAETAATKQMWRGPWRNQRCLIPASSWYEWFNAEAGTARPLKIPHLIERADGKEILFAGLWSWSPPTSDGMVLPTFAIVTVPSAPDIAEIHERTPVVLDPDYWMRWLDPNLRDPAAVREIIDKGAVEQFRMYTVDSAVSNARNTDPELLAPKDWPEMASQGRVRYTKAQLNWLRMTAPDEVQRELRIKLDATSPEQLPVVAERRLWIRHLMDRDDAEVFSALIEQIRDTLRDRKPEAPKPEPVKKPKQRPKPQDSGQGSLF